ncbi:hypothetical protein RCL_jg620.t1 [Rhizophagus clarus]|uniref:Uncharacterized protein n=1 Tax=Rhizophagus clarus TaxID=94130 RepID=A0A8H3LIZ5_9GLOM|nr:hypothetical protein RCL_jg620.t1 [Rhizophagus clarus]
MHLSSDVQFVLPITFHWNWKINWKIWKIGRFQSSNRSCELETSNQTFVLLEVVLEAFNIASNASNTTSNVA